MKMVMIFDFDLSLMESQYIQIQIETYIYLLSIFLLKWIEALIYYCIMLLLVQDSVMEINKGNAYKLNAV